MSCRNAIFVVLSTFLIISSCNKKEQVRSRPVALMTGSGPAAPAQAGGTTEKKTSENAPIDAPQLANGPADLEKLMIDQMKGWKGWYNSPPGNWYFQKILPDSTLGASFFVEIMPSEQPQGLEAYATMLLREFLTYGFNSITAKEELPDGWIIKGDITISYEPEEAPWEGPGFVIMRKIKGTIILCTSEWADDQTAFNEAIEMCRSAKFK